MTRLVFVGVVLVGCTKTPDPQVHEIGIESLAGSYQVADSFSNKLVKIPLDHGTYSVAVASTPRGEVRVVHVHGTVPRTPPVVVFELSPASSLPDPAKPVTLLGRCKPAVRDGVYRSTRADYSVTVADCLAAQSP